MYRHALSFVLVLRTETMVTNSYDESELQRAIIFLADNFAKTGTNKKPVVLHSLRVSKILMEQNAPQVSVMAAILHDVIEDTSVTLSDLKNEFGSEISKIVESLTLERSGSFVKKLAACTDSYKRSSKIGFSALIIRAGDLIDNSSYFKQSTSAEESQYLYNKFVTFMKIAKPYLKNTEYMPLLEKAYTQNVAGLRGLAQTY